MGGLIYGILLQGEEVKAVKWASKEEILSMIDKKTFIPYTKSLVDLIFFMKDHDSVHTRKDKNIKD
ncbi:hypothetical protein ACTNDG_13110 [Clostridium sp. HCP1S3_B4]|uniref:hypothetical protein n=1 Tax=unclassified Clostridium TaxID=2614128 RepID=UPI003F8C9B72